MITKFKTCVLLIHININIQLLQQKKKKKKKNVFRCTVRSSMRRDLNPGPSDL